MKYDVIWRILLAQNSTVLVSPATFDAIPTEQRHQLHAQSAHLNEVLHAGDHMHMRVDGLCQAGKQPQLLPPPWASQAAATDCRLHPVSLMLA
jgi:hypothetical protein